MSMTYRELSDWIENHLTEDQKDCDVAVYSAQLDESWQMNGVDIVRGDNHVLAGVLDEEHPVLVFDLVEAYEDPEHFNPLLYE